MKFFKILSHPYTLMICFCLIMISGEHLGGFYALYILLGLPFLAVHSLLAVAGVLVLLVSYHRSRNKNTISQLLNFLGALLLLASICFFFWSDKQHYNWGSFEQTVPVLSMIIAACVAVCFLLGTLTNAPAKKVMAV